MAAVASSQPPQTLTPLQHQNHAYQHQQVHMYPSQHSIMEDLSDDESGHEDEEMADDESFEGDIAPHGELQHPDQNSFYRQQQQQALYYQQHQQRHGEGQAGPSRMSPSKGINSHAQDGLEDEEMYSDDESSTASIPDEDIDFSLTYALHTFLATVEGQASVVKGDSLLLLDDANSYWWLVRVLKTEDVGYIPAENIETPYERLARLNKHRNVDLAAATVQEKQAGTVQDREKLKGMIAGKAKGVRMHGSGEGTDDGKNRRVFFGQPTYIDHPGKTWSSDEEDEESGPEDEVEESLDDREEDISEREGHGDYAGHMEPDDGVEWADSAGREQQNRIVDQRQNGQTVQARSNNPFARQSQENQHANGQAVDETRRITVTPAVAQVNGGGVNRNVSSSSAQSINSIASAGSARSSNPSSSPEKDDKKVKKEGGEKKKKGMLGGLFSRKSKPEKKGISSSDPRSSEESMVSGALDNSPGARMSEESTHGPRGRAPTPADRGAAPAPHSLAVAPGVSAANLRLQQREQAAQQAYATKYLNNKPIGADSPIASEAAAAVAQSAAAMRLAVNLNSGGRPSSIIVSPNPAGPPLLNVIRIFAGDHIKSEASFKTALVNETTTATDLIRQAMQRFHFHAASTPGSERNYFLTIKDVSGEEMELAGGEKPLVAILEAIQRYADEDDPQLSDITPTVKRSSIASISSIASLSSHPAIAKLGMNDFSDDSAVKIYINRRRPGSHIGMPEPASEFSSYTNGLSTVHEGSPEATNGELHNTPGSSTTASDVTPPAMRYNPSLTVNTTGHVSPERFSSPSARFTIQLVIHPTDLPDNVVFDPSSDSLISKMVMRDRLAAGHPMIQTFPADHRRRLFVLPKNATVVEAIEQGLERFGITEGVVDGGDDVEDRRRAAARVKYGLSVRLGGNERHLSPSGKLIDAFSTPPVLRPAERMTKEERRRSREVSANTGVPTDILPTDPVFVLRKVGPLHRPHQRHIATAEERGGVLQQQQAQAPSAPAPTPAAGANGPMSPQEIIAAQRAASRANQSAIISAQENQSKGVDVVVPDKGTLRSSRLLEADGEVVRYSFIDDDGSTYDISELLEDEWHKGSEHGHARSTTLAPPVLSRQPTDGSTYVTAPSTPEPSERRLSDGKDLLAGVLHPDQPVAKVEEKVQRVIARVKNEKDKSPVKPAPAPSPILTAAPPGNGRQTPTDGAANGPRVLSPVVEGFPSNPARPSSRSESRQNYHQTAATVNRIISRHRQQPSIASILSDIDSRNNHGDDDGSSTPVTTTSSSHATPPLRGAVFTRAVSASSPIPRQPVVYTDDFGMKTLMGIVSARARQDPTRPQKSRGAERAEPVDRQWFGERIAEGENLHPDVRACYLPVQQRLDHMDREIDELLGMLIKQR